MAEHVITFSMPLDKAKKIARKSVQGKFAVLSDSGNTMKVGTPPLMTALITFEEGKITIAGKGAGAVVASTCASSIKIDIEDAEEQMKSEPAPASAPAKIPAPASAPKQASAPAPKPAPQVNLDQLIEAKLKLTKLLKEYKDLLDQEIITKEEFDSLKENILKQLVFDEKVVIQPSSASNNESNEGSENEVVLVKELAGSTGKLLPGTKCTLVEENGDKSVLRLDSGKLIKVSKSAYKKA